MRAAGRLFSRKGFAGTSIEEIASSARASPSSIYWHFKGGKDDILVAVLEEAADFYTETILAAVRRGTSIEEKAEILLAAAEKQVRSGTETMRLIMQLALDRADRDPAVRNRVRRIYRKCRAAIVEEMQADLPRMPPVAMRSAAALLIGVFEGVFLQWQLEPEEVDVTAAFTMLRMGVGASILALRGPP